jgi:hypothetical protein
MLTAPLGVRLSHALPVKTLKRSFGVILLAIALRMVWTIRRVSFYRFIDWQKQPPTYATGKNNEK